MSINTNYSSRSYDPSFYDLAKHDISEIEKKGGFAKLDTLADLRASGDKLMRTEDIESLMKKYDSDSYATYSKLGKTQDGAYSKEEIQFLDKWVSDVKKGVIIENLYDNKLWKKYDISDDGSRSDVARVDTLADLRNAKGMSYMTEDIAELMKKYDPDAYKTYSSIKITPGGEVNPGGIQFLNKWVNAVKNGFIKESDSQVKSSTASVNSISAKNEEKLSKKAQDFLKNLRAKYGNYDFMVGNGSDDIRTLSKNGSKEFSIIFSNAELERMANDENYASEKMFSIENSVNMCRKIFEQQGYVSAYGEGNNTINKVGVVSDDHGNMKFFAELEKTSNKQKERLEKSREKKSEEKKAVDRRAHKKNPYERDSKASIKRTTIEANSYNELLDKLENMDWSKISDSKSGDRFNFSV